MRGCPALSLRSLGLFTIYGLMGELFTILQEGALVVTSGLTQRARTIEGERGTPEYWFRSPVGYAEAGTMPVPKRKPP